MFCTSCGKQMPDGISFCTNCGKPMTVINNPAPPAQQVPVPPVIVQATITKTNTTSIDNHL